MAQLELAIELHEISRDRLGEGIRGIVTRWTPSIQGIVFVLTVFHRWIR